MYDLISESTFGVLPTYRASIEVTTKEKNYRMIIRATFHDICVMKLGSEYIIKWFNTKASRWLRDKFNRIRGEELVALRIIPSDAVVYDVQKGLEIIYPNVYWMEHRSGKSGFVKSEGIRRFAMTRIIYDSMTSSKDIRESLDISTVNRIVETYNLQSYNFVTWTFGGGHEVTTCVPLAPYYTRSYR